MATAAQCANAVWIHHSLPSFGGVQCWKPLGARCRNSRPQVTMALARGAEEVAEGSTAGEVLRKTAVALALGLSLSIGGLLHHCLCLFWNLS